MRSRSANGSSTNRAHALEVIKMNQLSTPSLEPRLVMVPITRLDAITHGVRRTNGVSIDQLVASIEAEGLLQNLTVIKDPESPLAGAEEFENYVVIAGCRRLRALRVLVDRKKLPADYEVPCRLIDASQALSASLAENAVREAMHPADEYVAFKEMIEQGKSIEDVAARYGVTPLVVQRRLKLANVSPNLFELFRTDAMKLDQMMALTLSDDHKAQEAAWFVQNDWQRTARNIRDTLTKTELSTDCELARFVGLDEYRRAGGAVRRDLFGDQDAGYILDAKLLQSLAAAKLEAVADSVRKEGWSWVEVIPDGLDYEQRAQYSKAQPTGKRKPTDIERKRIKELTAERAAAEKKLNAAPDESACTDEQNDELTALDDRIGEIGSLLGDIDAGLNTWPPAILSKAGAIITLDGGACEIERGLVKGKLKIDKDTRDAKSETKAKEIAKGAGHTDSLVRDLSAQVGFAIAAELIAQPGMAVIALTHALALRVFYNSTGMGDPIKIAASHTSLRLGDEAGKGSPDVAKVETERKAIQALLPKKSGELLDWLRTKGNDVSRVLAYCMAVSVDAVQFKESTRPSEPLARALKLDMRPRWSATADSYLSRVSAAQILAALADAGVGKAELAKFDGLKKSELIGKAQPLLKNWVPKLMRFDQVKK
jgi:ParB family chromosome partitioning protein